MSLPCRRPSIICRYLSFTVPTLCILQDLISSLPKTMWTPKGPTNNVFLTLKWLQFLCGFMLCPLTGPSTRHSTPVLYAMLKPVKFLYFGQEGWISSKPVLVIFYWDVPEKTPTRRLTQDDNCSGCPSSWDEGKEAAISSFFSSTHSVPPCWHSPWASGSPEPP